MRVAVIGFGSAGRRHAGLAAELGHRVAAYDPAATEASAEVELCASLDRALDGADAAVVASPSAMHAEHALAALGAGVPALVEKPLATSVPDAARVARTARDAGLVCGVAMNLRFHPGVATLAGLLRDGELGRPLLARASFGYDLRLWRPGTDYRDSYSARAELGGGIVLDAIHELDYLHWMLGDVASASAETGLVSDMELDVEDVAVVALRFASGAFASLDLNFVEPAYRRSCTVAGDVAAADWDWSAESVTVRRAGYEPRTIAAHAEPLEMYRGVLEDFLAAVAERADPRTSADEGVAVLAVAEAVKRAAAEGRRVEL